MTPTGAGRARLFVQIAIVLKGKSVIPWIGRWLLASQPRWFTHLDAHETIDGDSMILMVQERVLRKQEAKGVSWRDAFFMPTSSDMCAPKGAPLSFPSSFFNLFNCFFVSLFIYSLLLGAFPAVFLAISIPLSV